jgi:lipid II:glycine glycyltransferase (peptidoglycan interpeptide bridge formation enzyme)
MTIKKITENQKKAFNKAAAHPLQSWEWGWFREKAGNKIVRLASYSNSKLVDTLQLTLHSIPFTNFKIGTFLKGPKATKEMIKALKDLAGKENLIFIKLEPNVVASSLKQGERERIIKTLKDSGCVPGKTLFTPTTFWIDLSPSEEELLKSFHSKTRYNIHLAQRKGVKVAEDNSKQAFEKHIQLTRETVERQGFYAHTEDYHRLMWKVLNQDMVRSGQAPIARLLTARYKNEIITTWILFVWKDFLYYPYGASSDKYKNVMANNLIMWEAIRYGKSLGLKTFDLWGREPGKGFTKFKEGYGPKVIEFLGTWDLVTNPLYWLYRMAESLRWLILHLRVRQGLVRPSF